MTSFELRQRFIEFFKNHHHTVVESSALIPAQDPTILFTNAGMNQFKDLFLGLEERSYNKAVSIQKCMRAGGKHNDLDNVGYTSRHLTFFEMMGNFSFGDYFKKQAIELAWNFLTKALSIEATQLYATVFEHDDEAYELWHQHLPQERIFRLGAKDNFWQMGDTGPCGPCTEILIDRGAEFGCKASDCSPSCPCGERFLEIWNLVFMQYDRQADGTDKPLKKTGVDTGMGLERLCMVMQGAANVYQTDLFVPLLDHIEHLTGCMYTPQQAAIFHVIAEHTRAASFLIADGCSPSNEGRGYVLRKIIRRAALFSQKITHENILPELSGKVIELMSCVYPSLLNNKELIFNLLSLEVQQFSKNLIQGQLLLETYFKQNTSGHIKGDLAFKLYDTHGFPIELIRVVAKEKNYTLDEQGFKTLMDEQRKRSGKKVKSSQGVELDGTTDFVGYESIHQDSAIQHIMVENGLVEQVDAHTPCWIIPTQTPFFAACGGQVSDTGIVIINNQSIPVLEVQKFNHAIGLKVKSPIELHTHLPIQQIVDQTIRSQTMKNHTATHLLQAALIEILGNQVRQAGSLVHPDYLRFDFRCNDTISTDQITAVENLVNQKIMQNIMLKISTTTYKKAIDQGVMAIFGEKYNPESVRVVDVPGFSAELCGGTHVESTGDIGVFKITHVLSLSAGQRRIVALTGPQAIALFQHTYTTLQHLSQRFKVKPQEVEHAVERQAQEIKSLNQQQRVLKNKYNDLYFAPLFNQLSTTQQPMLIIEVLNNYESMELKQLAQHLITQGPAWVFLVSSSADKAVYYATSSAKNITPKEVQQLFVALKEQMNITGGLKECTMQGGITQFNEHVLRTIIAQWFSSL